jgi:hypothetical protein
MPQSGGEEAFIYNCEGVYVAYYRWRENFLPFLLLTCPQGQDQVLCRSCCWLASKDIIATQRSLRWWITSHIKNPIYDAIDSQVKGKFDHTCQSMLLLLPEKSVSDISNVLLLDPSLSFLLLNEAYFWIYSTPRDKSLDGQGLRFMILGNYTVALVMRSSSILMCSRAV